MLGNVYTEEINKSWLCRSRAFYPYYFIVISWCKQVLFTPLFKKLFKKYLPLRLYIRKRLIGADKTSIVQPKMAPFLYVILLHIPASNLMHKNDKKRLEIAKSILFYIHKHCTTSFTRQYPILQVYSPFSQFFVPKLANSKREK